ncbi:hypothetical protein BC936DRAFT_145507 [Jimgerdemannia flammicorona]|uniref:Probable DNA polymerase n=1 Tax=Jimgerdemannia flammicorona TaxID=994334 RepID=A0A433D9T8_9FUNG|nr:hypothetical protein BC936DRAFT_145507 [Jimgerdemannia flammicorona]
MSNTVLLPYAIGFSLSNPDSTPHKTFTYYLTDFLNVDCEFNDFFNGYYEYEDHVYEEASNTMMLQCLTDLSIMAQGYTIYVHNLAGFDSLFLLKPLTTVFGDYDLISDRSRDVISITLPGPIIIKDSCRILTASLKTLSNMYDVAIKKGEFDHASVTFKNIVDIQKENKLLGSHDS